MLRRPIVLALIGAAALVLAIAPAALGALVHVRVEGKTQTIFGAGEPRAVATNALDALEAASFAGEFYYHVTQASFGQRTWTRSAATRPPAPRAGSSR